MKIRKFLSVFFLLPALRHPNNSLQQFCTVQPAVYPSSAAISRCGAYDYGRKRRVVKKNSR